MIRRIKVDNLWGERSIDWTLTRQVCVLSGTNGTGKSTVLRSVYELFSKGSLDGDFLSLYDRLEVTLDDGSVYSSDAGFRPESVKGNVLSNRCGKEHFSDSDLLSYTSDGVFCDLVDRYLSLTRKKIVRGVSEFRFMLPSGRTIPFPLLSSGEQELIKMLALASEATADDVIILDEPENSLHFDWQKSLLESVIESAHGVQLIVATHSPAIIMDGWLANVDNIDAVTRSL